MDLTAPDQRRPYALIESGGESILDLSARDFEDSLRAHGALLLRGFTVDMESFRAFTDRSCVSEVFNESPDRAFLGPEKNIQTVNLGVDPFPLHPELSREPFRPDACFFWCLTPPASGGETTVCDGVEIARQMPRAAHEAFSGRRLLYNQFAVPEVLEYWLGTATPDAARLASPPDDCPYTFFRNAGRIVRSFSRPALNTAMFTDEPAFANFILFARYYLKLPNFPVFGDRQPISDALAASVKEVSDTLTAPVEWRAGDIIVLDNSRFMHGRNAIRDPARRLIASYFGYLRFAPVNAEEPPDPRWRRETFHPPHRKSVQQA